MLTDRYELTQLAAALADGIAHRPAVFELFTRRLPAGRSYGVVAGVGRFLDELEHFTFDTDELAWLEQVGAIDAATRDYLTGWKFTGTIRGYAEGELFFPHSPVLSVYGTFGDAVLLETLALSIYNHDSAVASAAARMVAAANGRPLLEMGSRRTHEAAAVAAARAAYLTGFSATSNLAAGYAYGVPTMGTSAHAFTLAHVFEQDAFTSQVAQLGTSTTLLVDTYDIAAGIEKAVKAAGPDLGGIRLDSGKLDDEARKARIQLDSLGATSTKVVVTGDLDEYVIADVGDDPVDTYGVGTRLVTGSGHPSAGFVYKLVAIGVDDDPESPMRPVAKAAAGKASVGGAKRAHRILDPEGHLVAEHVAQCHDTFPAPPAGGSIRTLQKSLVVNGHRTDHTTLEDARTYHRQVMSELTDADHALAVTAPRITGGTR